MNLRFWLLLFSLAAVSVAPPSPPSPSPSPHLKSWFREKYLVAADDTYYDYTLNRFRLDDNDIDMCPDIYKSATIFAITGRYIHEIKRTCNSIYMQKRRIIINSYSSGYNVTTTLQDELRDIQEMIDRGITDIFQISGVLICYTFEFGMILVSVILALYSTLFMIILLFCQY
jgi:hypothetical protein